MNHVVDTNASKQVHGLPGSQNTLSPHWLYFFVLADLFCLCFAFLQQVCALWLKETKGNLYEKVYYFLLLKLHRPLNFCAAFIDYCKTFD